MVTVMTPRFQQFVSWEALERVPDYVAAKGAVIVLHNKTLMRYHVSLTLGR